MLKVVGAGLGRTGTLSLKLALERLLGAPCHHMLELVAHPEQIPVWHAATRGEMPDWKKLMDGYAASVDWPSAGFWPELATAFPDALVLLSVRDAEAWWKSAGGTIFPALAQAPSPEWRAMIESLFASRFTSEFRDHDAAIAAFERNSARVHEMIPAGRLLEWRAGDGWAPICRALGVAIPAEPFPHVNTTAEFNARRAAIAK